MRLEHDKAFGKIGEIKAKMEKADELVKSTIIELKESSVVEISTLFDKVMGIKNELIEDSQKLKEKFDKIDKEEIEKQEFVLEEIKRIELKITDQNEFVNKAIEGINSQSTASETVSKIDSSEIDSKIVDLKTEIEKELTCFKEEMNKDKDFERDRILNCVQELNDIKNLVDQKIDYYDKGQVEKQSQFTDNADELRSMIVDFEFQIQAISQEIKNNSERVEETDKKVHEVEQKYGRVARQANEISAKVEIIEKCDPKESQTQDKDEESLESEEKGNFNTFTYL